MSRTKCHTKAILIAKTKEKQETEQPFSYCYIYHLKKNDTENLHNLFPGVT